MIGKKRDKIINIVGKKPKKNKYGIKIIFFLIRKTGKETDKGN